MNILFVCTGNTCRSVMAEYILKSHFRLITNGLSVSSRGTAASENYRVPEIVKKLLAGKNDGLSAHVSTQLSESDVRNSDIIFVMENAHRTFIERTFGYSEKIRLLGGDVEITDPLGKPESEYVKTYEVIKKYLDKLVAKGLFKNVYSTK